jgi:hypothetical protein
MSFFQQDLQQLVELKAQSILDLHPNNWRVALAVLDTAPRETFEIRTIRAILKAYAGEYDESRTIAAAIIAYDALPYTLSLVVVMLAFVVLIVLIVLLLRSDPNASNLQRASAAWASCFSYSRGSTTSDGFEKGVAIANEGMSG